MLNASSASPTAAPSRSISEKATSGMGRPRLEQPEALRQEIGDERRDDESEADRDGQDRDDVQERPNLVDHGVRRDEDAEPGDGDDDADLHRPENAPHRRADTARRQVDGGRSRGEEPLA